MTYQKPNIDDVFHYRFASWRVSAISQSIIVGTLANVISIPANCDQIICLTPDQFAQLAQGENQRECRV